MTNINIYNVIGVVFILLNFPFFVQGQNKCTKCDSTKKKSVRIRIISFQAGDPTFKTVLQNKDTEAVNKFDVIGILYSVNEEGSTTIIDTVYNHVVGKLRPNEEVTIMSCFSFEGEGKPDSIQGTLILYDTIDCSINFRVEDDISTRNFKPSESCPQHIFQSEHIKYLASGESEFLLEDGDTVVLISRDECNQKVFLEATLDTTLMDTIALDTIKLVSTFNSLKMHGARWKLHTVGGGGDSVFYLQPLLTGNNNYVLAAHDNTFILVDINSENINAQWNMTSLNGPHTNNVHHVYINESAGMPETYLCKEENNSVGITTSFLEREIKWYIHKLND